MAGAVDHNLRAIVIGATILSALAAAVWFGSWQNSRGGANEQPKERGTVAGFTTYEVSSANFSIAVPQSWRTFTAEEAFGDSEALDQLERENPEFAQYRDALSDPRSPMKLVAVDPNVRGGFATNVNVIAQKVSDDFSFEDFAQQSEAEIRQLAGMSTGMQTKVVELPAGRAQRLSYQATFTLNGQERSISTLQYGLVADGWLYVITYTTLPQHADEYRNDFERSVSLFTTD
jgi:hypothetical protein